MSNYCLVKIRNHTQDPNISKISPPFRRIPIRRGVRVFHKRSTATSISCLYSIKVLLGFLVVQKSLSMNQELHHPTPRLPEGWKQFQADNIDITTTADIHPTGRHSRSPSALSNHSYSTPVIRPSQIQNNTNNAQDLSVDFINESIDQFGMSPSQFASEHSPPSHFQQPSSIDEFDNPGLFHNNTESRKSDSNSSYFHSRATRTAPMSTSTATAAQSSANHASPDPSNSNNSTSIDDFYLTSTDPSNNSPSFINSTAFASSTSPPLLQDTLSPFAPYLNSFDAQQAQQQNTLSAQPFETIESNTLGLHWRHHRSRSDQSDLSSNASPFIGSVHSEQGSPYISAQDPSFEDELREAILGLDMGAQYDVPTQYQNNTGLFDTSTLELDQQGFPIDAQLYDRQQDYYTPQQPRDNTSRPPSSSSYHQPAYNSSIFQSTQPNSIQTSIPPSFQSPPLPSATSIPEIEVTIAPPTPRTQAFHEYFPQPYNPSQRPGSSSNSPSLPPSYIYSELPALSLPSSGRRRAVSESGPRPPMPPPANGLVRRVSSGSHPYLAPDGSGSTSGRSTPARGHRKSWSHGGAGVMHNMTHRDVLDLIKPEGPREAKNPKKFVCDYPGCGQRFTRNSNKTYYLCCGGVDFRTHMLTHKNERPHVCPRCQKDFTRQHDWKRHMELHDPSKKFKCAGTLADGRSWGCNKEFARKDALSRHFKSQQVRSSLIWLLTFRDDSVLRRFFVKDGLWRICTKHKALLWEHSAETHQRGCTKNSILVLRESEIFLGWWRLYLFRWILIFGFLRKSGRFTCDLLISSGVPGIEQDLGVGRIGELGAWEILYVELWSLLIYRLSKNECRCSLKHLPLTRLWSNLH